jgi:hypothetical protein
MCMKHKDEFYDRLSWMWLLVYQWTCSPTKDAEEKPTSIFRIELLNWR